MFGDEDDEEAIGAVRYPCMPSLVALQQMRTRLHLAYLGRKLMKWTSLATGSELRRLANEIHAIYNAFGDDMKNAFIVLARGRYFYPNLNKMVLENCPPTASVTVYSRNKTVSGVKCTHYEVGETGVEPYEHLGIEKGGQQIHEAKIAWLELLKRMVMMLELRNNFVLVETANRNATKRLNAIRKIVIPRTQVTIHYILLELDEKAREEMYKIKLIKKKKARELEMKAKKLIKKLCPICTMKKDLEELKAFKELYTVSRNIEQEELNALVAGDTKVEEKKLNKEYPISSINLNIEQEDLKVIKVESINETALDVEATEKQSIKELCPICGVDIEQKELNVKIEESFTNVIRDAKIIEKNMIEELGPICFIDQEDLKEVKVESVTEVTQKHEHEPNIIVQDVIPAPVPPTPPEPQVEKEPPPPRTSSLGFSLAPTAALLSPPTPSETVTSKTELSQKIESMKDIHKPNLESAVVEQENLTRILSSGQTNEDSKLQCIKSSLTEIIKFERGIVTSKSGKIHKEDFLRVCEEAKGKIDNFVAEEEWSSSQVDPNLQNCLEHLKLPLSEVIDMTNDFKCDTMGTGSVELLIETCEEMNETLAVYIKNVDSKLILDDTKIRLNDIIQGKNETLLTGLEHFRETSEDVEEKFDVYVKSVESKHISNDNKTRLDDLKQLRNGMPLTGSVEDFMGISEEVNEKIDMPVKSIESKHICDDCKIRLDDFRELRNETPLTGSVKYFTETSEKNVAGEINVESKHISDESKTPLDDLPQHRNETLLTSSVEYFYKTIEKVNEKLTLDEKKFERKNIPDESKTQLDDLKQHRNETPLTGSKEHSIKTSEKADDKLTVDEKNVASKHISDESKTRLDKLKQRIRGVVEITEDYKQQGLITPSVEEFIKCSRSVESKIDTYNKVPNKNHDVNLKEHVCQLEKLTTDINEEATTTSSWEKLLLSCKDFQIILEDYKKRAKLPSRDTLSCLENLVSQPDKSKDERLTSESVDEFIRICEDMKNQLANKDDKEMPLSLGELKTNIDTVIAFIKNLEAEGVITESAKDFLITCEITKERIKFYDQHLIEESEMSTEVGPCSKNVTYGEHEKEPANEMSESRQEMTEKPVESVLPFMLEPCDRCHGLAKYEEEEEAPCDICSQVVTSNLSTDCNEAKQEKKLHWTESPLHPELPPEISKPPSLGGSSLGYFEEKTKKVIRITRTMNEDGTIREETETIITRKNRHDPTVTSLDEDDSEEDGDVASFDDISDYPDVKCCALCLNLNNNQLGFRISRSEQTIKQKDDLKVSKTDPNFRQKRNVLSKTVVPRIMASIQYIRTELEEMEREEIFRLKRVKEKKEKKNKIEKKEPKKPEEPEAIKFEPKPVEVEIEKIEEIDSVCPVCVPEGIKEEEEFNLEEYAKPEEDDDSICPICRAHDAQTLCVVCAAGGVALARSSDISLDKGNEKYEQERLIKLMTQIHDVLFDLKNQAKSVSRSTEKFIETCSKLKGTKETLENTPMDSLCNLCKDWEQQDNQMAPKASHKGPTKSVSFSSESKTDIQKAGYSETKTEKIIKISKFQNKDGTVDEKKKVITIETKRKVPENAEKETEHKVCCSHSPKSNSHSCSTSNLSESSLDSDRRDLTTGVTKGAGCVDKIDGKMLMSAKKKTSCCDAAWRDAKTSTSDLDVINEPCPSPSCVLCREDMKQNESKPQSRQSRR